MRHTRCALALLILLASFCAMARAASEKPLQVLFVGNSLTCVGNLTAVLEALASGNGKSLQANMIVKGGATLTQWLDPGTVPSAKMLDVRAPMYVPGSKFAPPAPVSLPLLPEVPLAGGYDYSRDEMTTAIGLAH